MDSLHDAARRLSIPVELLWTWIADGVLAAHVKPGRGSGMEYFLDASQMKSAREVRDRQINGNGRVIEEQLEERPAEPDNVIAVDFGDGAGTEVQQPSAAFIKADDFTRSSALMVMENLRKDTLAAVQHQAAREDAMLELVDAVDMVLTTTLKAMARAQDLSQARLAAELETVRARLNAEIRAQVAEDLALNRELERTKSELHIALKDVDLTGDSGGVTSVGRGAAQTSRTAEKAPVAHDA